MAPPRPRNCTNIISYLPLLKNCDQILKQGFMIKRGHLVKNWKGKTYHYESHLLVRYITLTPLALSYSTKPEVIRTPIVLLIS
jgi:hypothetical protein